MQDVVAVAAADAGDRALVAQDRVDAPVVRRGTQQSASASALSTSGPSFASGPSSPGASTHQPALRCLPNSFTRIDGRSSSRKRTTAPRGLVVFGGASTSTRPPCDRCTSTRRPSSSSTTTYFPRLDTRRPPRPADPAARGVTVFNDENCRTSAPRHVPPPPPRADRSAEARTSGSSGIGSPAHRRPPPRARSPTHSSIRSACVRCDTMQIRSQYSPPISVDDRNTRFDALIRRKQLAVRRLVAAAQPERDDGELRLPADLDRRVGARAPRGRARSGRASRPAPRGTPTRRATTAATTRGSPACRAIAQA